MLYSRLSRIRDTLRAYCVAWTRRADWANWPALLDHPPGRRVLVIAPHPDDDVIGCGGTLCKHIEAGDRVTCVYLTDGGHGVPDFPDPTQAAAIRRQEAEAAAGILGVDDLVFLNGTDGALDVAPELITTLQAVFADRQPDLVYVPFFLDPHADHRAANDVLATIVTTRDFHFRCCAYEVWSPLVPNTLVDISAQMPRKLEAIRCHRSQVEPMGYERVVQGLNTYRTTQFAGQVQYAEAFYMTDLRDYLKLWEQAKQLMKEKVQEK